MRYRFVLKGEAYSRNKGDFKKLLKKHRLSFTGSFGNFVWSNDRESVRAEFERDEEKDITTAATLVWEGRKKTDFMEELKAWVWEVGGSTDKEDAAPPKASDVAAKVAEELEFWDSINRPDVPHLKATGRPEEWIKRDVEAWRKMRREKKKELTAKYSG